MKTLKMLTSPIKFSFPQGVTMNSNKSRFNPSFVPFIKVKLYSRKGWSVIFFCRFCDVPTKAESNILRLTGDPGELLGHVCDNQGKVLFNVLRLVTNDINKIHSLNSQGLMTEEWRFRRWKRWRRNGVPFICAHDSLAWLSLHCVSAELPVRDSSLFLFRK